MITYIPALSTQTWVDDVIRKYPSVLSVLDGLGIDTCCGGAQSLASAARSASIPIEALMAAIGAAMAGIISSPVSVACTYHVQSHSNRRQTESGER